MWKALAKAIVEALLFFVGGLLLIPLLFVGGLIFPLSLYLVMVGIASPLFPPFAILLVLLLLLSAIGCCYRRRWPLAAALVVGATSIFVIANRSSCRESSGSISTGQIYNGSGAEINYNDKPVIYLYPQTPQSVTVRLSLKNGTLSATYPEFDTAIGGWKVTATSDGRLTDSRDGREYSYLFWESLQTSAVAYDLLQGFVVKGDEVREFLGKILPETGLTPKEYNEFIVYWYPRLMNIPLMQIYFAGKEYTDSAQLSIEPRPDSMLRVFMVVRPLKEPILLTPQKLPSFERKGFSVVEWGGTLLP